MSKQCVIGMIYSMCIRTFISDAATIAANNRVCESVDLEQSVLPICT